MQNKSQFESSSMRENNEEIVVDCWDLIYTAIRKWPVLLAGLLCGAVLLGGFSVWRSRRKLTAEEPVELASIEEQVESARERLDEAAAIEVEGMYAQYKEYAMLQTLLRNQYAEYLRDINKVDNSYVKTLKYLCSSEDAGPSGIFDVQTVLSEDVSKEIGRIIAGETDARKAAILSRNRVFFTTDQNYKLAVSDQEILPARYILTVRIIGDDKGQCDQIQVVVENRMNDIRQSYLDAGGKFEMTPFASDYANTAADLVKDGMVSLSGQLRSVTDNLNSFQSNTIDKLDSDSKAYYELLQEQGRLAASEEETDVSAPVNDAQPAAAKSMISKRLVVVGAMAGVFVAALIILLQYILTSVIQSRDSFASLCGIPLTAAVYKKGQSSTGLRLKLYRMLHKADELTRGKTAAIAQDMGIELEKNNAGSLYLLLSDNSEELRGFAKALSDDMHSQHPNLKVKCGAPLNDQEQMKALSGSDAAVLLVGLKKAAREDTAQQLQMCGRYQVPVMGFVTFEVV